MIRAILMNSTSEYRDEDGSELYALYGLSRINIFIGANNSGKSRLMRRLLNTNIIAIDDMVDAVHARKFEDALSALRRSIEYSNSHSGLSKIDVNYKLLDKLRGCGKRYEVFEYISSEINKWNAECGKCNNDSTARIGSGMYDIIGPLRKNRSSFGADSKLENCFYIPTLRGIEKFDSFFDKTSIESINDARLSRKEWGLLDRYADNAHEIYKNKISMAYGIEKGRIFTAENMYEEIRDKLLGSEEERQWVKDFEDFISTNFYDGTPFTLIPTKNKNTKHKEYLSVKIGDTKERPIYDLGDGIKQLISMFYKIFEMCNKEAFFFIEEPELNLHPGFQTKFIKALNDERFKRHQYFIVTHSNHLLDELSLRNDVSLYRVENIAGKNKEFRVIRTTPKDIEILNVLGVKSSSVMMANCLIFVEGLSDKIYISKYLELYFKEKQKDYVEDIHYAFVETGGGNIAHWDFSDGNENETMHVGSFSNRSFVICDNDDNKKKERKEKLKQMVGEENFYELPVREIENTIKKGILEKAIFGEMDVAYAVEYDEEEGYYNNEKIGSFIDTHYNLGSKTYSAESGTIKNKIEFAQKVIGNIKTIDDITANALDMCEKITKFIEKSNI